jgi:hypothetical protein
MFRRNRERLEALERNQRELTAAINGLAQKLDAPAPAPSVDAMGLLVTAFTSMASQQSGLVNAFGDIAVKTAMKRNGIRGGKARTANAQRDKNGRLLPNPDRRISLVRNGERRCRLCVDPHVRDPTIAEITSHRNHALEVRAPDGGQPGEHNHDGNQSSEFVDPFAGANGPAH